MMNGTRATQIQTLLRDAADAIDRASALVASLDSKERAILYGRLDEISSVLHFELLQKIYLLYPALQRPAGEPVVDTTIRWEDVVLPASITEAELDRIIFAAVRVQWQKTARIVGDAAAQVQQRAPSVSAEAIGARLQALSDANRLESQGDIRSWRHSEVRLKR